MTSQQTFPSARELSPADVEGLGQIREARTVLARALAQPAHLVSGPDEGMSAYATSIADTVLMIAEHALTDHDAGSVQVHLVAFARTVAQRILALSPRGEGA